jgi:sulfate adenylyltransferase subunit 1
MPALRTASIPEFELLPETTPGIHLPQSKSAAENFLEQEQEKELLRFLTCGSVDDGKSTLIGRLLYDSRNVFEDQIQAAAKASQHRAGGGIDLSLLTDGLRAEREQGITIDVAYRYFATARRKFIIADTPGHEQYTRNMATGASTADLAILLIDARLGVLAQSRRHAFICSLLGIPRFVVAVNKMDLVDYDETTFDRIRAEFTGFLAGLGVKGAYFLPLSALSGDNVVSASPHMPWFQGASLLEHLETVPLGRDDGSAGFRMAVQRVVRPDHTFRGYAGQVTSGTLRPGDEVTVLPSGLQTRVQQISTFDGPLDEAYAPMAVTVVLEDHLDISRGDLLHSGDLKPHSARKFQAKVVWMDARPLYPRRRYLLKHTTRTVPAELSIRHRIRIDTLEQEAAESLEMNEIGLVEVATAQPLFFDAYQQNHYTGSFILIDSETNATSGAGMIVEAAPHEGHTSGPVTLAERMARWGHAGAVIRTGSRLGLAHALERKLFEYGCAVVLLETGQHAVADALAQAGLLAILPEHRQSYEEELPEGDAAACDEIVRRLHLSHEGTLHQGEGI